MTAQTTGSLSGYVTNESTGSGLSGALVRVPSSALRVATAHDGSYRLMDVPVGEVTVEVSYLGLETSVKQVQISATNNPSLNFMLTSNDVVMMETFQISGQRTAQAAALNQQRSSRTLSNVVSADQAGRFPDANVAEAMRRIPGVSVALEEKNGEGRYISIRGLDSGLNAFSLNGVRVAQSDEDNRRVALDSVHVGALSSITVHKTLSPDMDGDGIGGSVEMETASALEFGQRYSALTLEMFYNDFAEEPGYYFEGSYADIFGADDEFGMYVSVSREDRRSFGYVVGNDEEWAPANENDTGPGAAYVPGEEMEFNTFDNQREKTGISVAFDWRPSDSTTLSFKVSHNEFTDTEFNNGQHFITDYDYNSDGSIALEETSVAAYGEHEETEWLLSTAVLKGETHLDRLTLNYQASLSTGKREEPNDYEVFYVTELSNPVTWDLGDPYFPRPQLSAADSAALRDPSNYEFEELDIDYDKGYDDKYAFKLDATYDLDTSHPISIQAGVKWQRSDRGLSEANFFQSETALANTELLSTSGLLGPNESFDKVGRPYADFPGYSPTQLAQFGTFAPANFGDDTDNALPDADTYTATEDILAAYAMARMERGRWEIVGGARIEFTEVNTNNYELLEDASGESIQKITNTSKYTEVLPRLQVNYRASENLIWRGSVFTSLARPEFQYISAATYAEESGGSYEVELGNPDLDAAYAWNFDFGVERYFQRIGVLSANLFHKTIDGFIFNDTAPEASEDGTFRGAPAEFTMPINGGTATVSGLELNYVTQFSQLEGFLGGFGVYANLTVQESKANLGLEDRPEELSFFNAPDVIYTTALTYEKYGWGGTLAYSWRDRYLDTVFEDGLDVYAQPYGSLDFQISYRLASHWRAYLSVSDLLDDGLSPVLHRTRGTSEAYVEEISFNGRNLKLGITWNL